MMLLSKHDKILSSDDPIEPIYSRPEIILFQNRNLTKLCFRYRV
jgi:hypothetical protein